MIFRRGLGDEFEDDDVYMIKSKPTLKNLHDRLAEVSEKFDDLKKCGIDEEILEIYLMKKTGLSRKKVKSLLANVEEFYNKLAISAIANVGGK